MASISELLAASPVWLASMEDVSDSPYRRICRSVGAHVCVTEFVNAEALLGSSKLARRKMNLGAEDGPGSAWRTAPGRAHSSRSRC